MTDRITVDTQYGPIVGREKEGVCLFAGVPYAAAPLENLRFKPPQPPIPWTEPRETLKFGPAAPQVPTGGMTDSAQVRWSEDCLTLNVQTPACDDAGRAVMVWIHGGGYRTGQSSIPWYNGARFAANGDTSCSGWATPKPSSFSWAKAPEGTKICRASLLSGLPASC